MQTGWEGRAEAAGLGRPLVVLAAAVVLAFAGVAAGVRTQYVVQETEEQFKEGEPNGVVITSQGVLRLGPAEAELLGAKEGDWLVNAVAADAEGAVYAATSGQGRIYRLGKGQEPEVVYEGKEAGVRHVFSLGFDGQGRLLAGTGGEKGKVLRRGEGGEWEEVWAGEGVSYVWALVADGDVIYAGTGPEGQVWAVEGDKGRVIFDAKVKNILSVAVDEEGVVYAGGDEEGLIYRIEPVSGAVRVVYDTGHQEVSGLAFDAAGTLYAGTADVEGGRPGKKLILSDGLSGRPEEPEGREGQPEPEPAGEKGSGVRDQGSGDAADASEEEKSAVKGEEKAEAAEESAAKSEEAEEGRQGAEAQEEEKDRGQDARGTEQGDKAAASERVVPPATGEKAQGEGAGGRPASGPARGAGRGPGGPANEVFAIRPDGYVRSVFKQPVVILSVATTGVGEVILGTGNEGQVLWLDVDRQEAQVLASSEESVQASAVAVGADGTVYAGWANPAGVVALGPGPAKRGTYVSGVVDAEQITQWGKMQLEATVPVGVGLTLATRSGNVEDPEQGGWGPWTQAVKVGEDMAVEAAPARFLQYRLVLENGGSRVGPEVRQVKLAHRTANLAPVLASVEVKGVGMGPDEEAKQGRGYAVNWQASDENGDTLEYKVYVREVGRGVWIEVADELEKGPWQWDVETAADGRYEVKVEATDAPSNAAGEAMTDTRVSLPVVVDNTPATVLDLVYSATGSSRAGEQESSGGAAVEGWLRLRDEMSVVAGVAYAVDSAKEWKEMAPADGVFDSREEKVEFSVKELKAGEHLLSIRYDDALGNRAYRNVTFVVE